MSLIFINSIIMVAVSIYALSNLMSFYTDLYSKRDKVIASTKSTSGVGFVKNRSLTLAPTSALFFTWGCLLFFTGQLTDINIWISEIFLGAVILDAVRSSTYKRVSFYELIEIGGLKELGLRPSSIDTIVLSKLSLEEGSRINKIIIDGKIIDVSIPL